MRESADRRLRRPPRLALVAVLGGPLACLALACGAATEGPGRPTGEDQALSHEQLLDPQSCAGCHPRHYREWRSSMHAYAAAGPIFRAMNQRGQEETGGALGDFCVRCHAPMAVIEGQTQDGLNFEAVDDHLQGVTCYVCHTATDIAQDHNNGLILAGGGIGDRTMRGGLVDPQPTPAHGSAYSALLAGRSPQSSALCGSCHDVQLDSGLRLERTYEEYRTSLFADGAEPLTCNGCHMRGREGPVAVRPDGEEPAGNAPASNAPRFVHEHLWPAVDLPLTAWPDRALQRRATECELERGTRLHTFLAEPNGAFRIVLETTAGHLQPSGAAHQRRLWAEFVAYDARDRVIFQSGRLTGDEPVDKPSDDPAYDPHLQLFRGYLYGEDGEEVSMLWNAAASMLHPEGHGITALPMARPDAHDPTVELRYRVPELPARVTFRARIRPVALQLVDDLIASGHLAPEVRDRVPTLTLTGTAITWRPEDGYAPIAEPDPSPYRCPDHYRALLPAPGPAQ